MRAARIVPSFRSMWKANPGTCLRWSGTRYIESLARRCDAFHHAEATRIEVLMRYDPRQFRLQIVDNGKGIDPAVLGAGGRAGHHGVPGLHERAQLTGGNCPSGVKSIPVPRLS
jgi:hypothetical protein